MKTVYLAGGMRQKWRETIKSSVPEFRYLDPCDHGLSDPAAYTLWDLEAVKQSDFVFAYMADSNPSGAGLALEVGYAKALNIPIIFVDEKGDRYFAIVRACAAVTTTTLIEGIEILRSLAIQATAI